MLIVVIGKEKNNKMCEYIVELNKDFSILNTILVSYLVSFFKKIHQ